MVTTSPTASPFSLVTTFKAALLVYLGNGVKEMKYKASYKGLLFPHFLRLYRGSKTISMKLINNNVFQELFTIFMTNHVFKRNSWNVTAFVISFYSLPGLKQHGCPLYLQKSCWTATSWGERQQQRTWLKPLFRCVTVEIFRFCMKIFFGVPFIIVSEVSLSSWTSVSWLFSWQTKVLFLLKRKRMLSLFCLYFVHF